MCSHNSRIGKFTGGVFLIGLAFLFIIGDIFPGILFVLALTTFIRGVFDAQSRESLKGAAVLFTFGLIFTVGFNIGFLLLMIGLAMLVGAFFSDNGPTLSAESKLKRKNVEFI